MKGHPPVFFVMPQGAHSEPGQFRPSPVAQWRAVAGSTSSSPPLVLISTDVGRHLSQQMSQQQEGTGVLDLALPLARQVRSEEHTSELQSLMRLSYAVFCL